ncbi:VanW family protein [Sporosarcina sp. NPDC096371]|uniref:VanW family protein n=1 Tax=Sporosarcina sp. NPDC096371 TaxID=3364530 RepID=UPI0038295C9E
MKYYLPIATCAVLIVLLLYQVIVPPSIVSAKDRVQNGMIAEINIDGKKRSEIEALLAAEVTKWKEDDIVVQGSTAKIVIPSNYIKFDIKKTVNHYISTSSTPWYNFLGNNKKIQLPLEVSVDEKIVELLKEAPLFFIDETIEAIIAHAGTLQQGPVKAREVALSKDLLSRIAFETQEVAVNVTGLTQIVRTLDETTLLDGESLSFLGKLSEVDGFYSKETANFIASTLYSAVLKSEMDILERHSQHSVPTYLVAGIEVEVDAARKRDFAFVNHTNRPVQIYAFVKDGQLVIELYSFKSNAKVGYDVSTTEIIKPRTIYRRTPELAAGQERVLEEGKNGLRVQVEKRITDGANEKEVVISRDFYPAKDTVILVSSLSPSVSVITPDPTTLQSEETSTGNQTTQVTDGEQIEDDESVLIEKDALIPEVGTYDKGGNLITSDSE